MKKHYRVENDCLNCGATLQGKFCYVCGQENLQIKESFGHVMNHAISDYFHFDEQFFNTLKPLLFKPGKLTNEYMAGRRMSYLHPVKMYIFISFIYFLLVFNTGSIMHVDNNPTTKKDLTAINKKITSNPNLSAAQKKNLINRVNQYKIVQLKNGKTDTVYTHANDMFVTENGDTSYAQYTTNQQKLPVDKRDGFLLKYFNRKVFSFAKNGEDSTKVVMEEFKHNMPKLMFLLLPLFALLLKIAFSKSKKFYVEHLIYAFHLHCFVFLFLSVTTAINLFIPINWDILSVVAFIVIAWYVYRSLRVVYQRTAIRTITKMIGIGFSYFVIFCLGAGLLFIITAIIEV